MLGLLNVFPGDISSFVAGFKNIDPRFDDM